MVQFQKKKSHISTEDKVMCSVFPAVYEGNSEWVRWSPSVLYPWIGLLYEQVMTGTCKYRALAQH